MSKQTEAMKQALEALEHWDVHGKLHQPTEEAITALREALAEPAQQQEPVAWIDGATHYQPHQKAFYKRVSAAEWYVWSRVEQEPLHWCKALGPSDSANWILRQPAQEPLFKPLIDLHPGLAEELKEINAPVQQELVAWAKDTGKKLRITHMNMSGEEGWRPLVYGDTSPQPAQQEPVAVVDLRNANYVRWLEGVAYPVEGTHLYTSPPAQHLPLTDAEIGKAWASHEGEHNASASVKRRIIRAIEAANGIKEQP